MGFGWWMPKSMSAITHSRGLCTGGGADILQSNGELLWDASKLLGEITSDEGQIDECIASPSNNADHGLKISLAVPSHPDDLLSESGISEFVLADASCPDLKSVSDPSDKGNSDAGSCPGLQTVSNSSTSDCDDLSTSNCDAGPADVPVFLPRDVGLEAKTHTYRAAMLVNSVSPSTVETELYDSGASHHMLPYCHKFIDYIDIEQKSITAADSGTFQAISHGDMDILVPNGKTTTHILLQDVLYALKMGLTLVSISHITSAGFDTIFCQQSMKIYGP